MAANTDRRYVMLMAVCRLKELVFRRSWIVILALTPSLDSVALELREKISRSLFELIEDK